MKNYHTKTKPIVNKNKKKIIIQKPNTFKKPKFAAQGYKKANSKSKIKNKSATT